MSQPSTSKDKPDDVEMTKASQEGIRENTLHFRDYLSGTSGVTVIGLLAASSLIPLIAGGFSIPVITMWLSSIGGNALAGWLTTWAEKAAAKGILEDKDQRDKQLIQLATDLQQHFNQNNTESKELQDSLAALLDKVNAMQTILEANENEYIIEQLQSESRRNDLIKGKLHRLVMKELQSIQKTTSNTKATVEKTNITVEKIDKTTSETHQDVQRILHQISIESNTDQIQKAQQLLETLPLDVVPDAAPLPEPYRMPLRQNPLFVGREHDLLEIANALKHGQTTVIAAATGIGGIGKTQLASEFVHRYGQYFAGGIFWLSFANTNTIPNEIADCGGMEVMDLPQFENLELTQQIAQVMREWSRPIPRLLIFDNCEETDALDKYLPRTGGCRVLITSRKANWQADLGMQTLSIIEFSVDEGIRLLQKFRPDLSSNNVHLIEIVKDLGGLPLAIHLAGSYLKVFEDDLSPEEYLAELRSQNLLKHESLQGADITVSPTKHELHVGRTFALSYDRLNPDNNIDDCALTLLKHAACFAPGIPIAHNLLLETVEREYKGSERLIGRALNRLIDLGLLERTETGDLRLHRLIARFTENVMGHEEAQETIKQVIFRALYTQRHSFPINNKLLLQHASFVIDTTQKSNNLTAYLCNVLGHHLIQTDDYKNAQINLERALKICEIIEADDLIISILNNLGALYDKQANYSIASAFYELALPTSKSFFGEHHKQTITILNNLGTLHTSKGDFKNAQLYLEDALKLSKSTYGFEDPQTALIIFNFGQLCEEQGKYDQALDHYHRSLIIRQTKLGEVHPDTAQTLNNLGLLLTSLCRYEEAKFYFDRALRINIQVFGEINLRTAGDLNNIGYWFQSQLKYIDSEPYIKKALAIQQEILGDYHPSTATTLANLGHVLQAQRRFTETQNLFTKVLEIDKTIYGPDHPQIAIDLLNISGILYSQGKYEEVENIYEQALNIQERIIPQHPQTAETITMLALLFYQKGDVYKAIEFYKRALEILKPILEEKHYKITVVYLGLGNIFFEQYKYKQAETYFKKALPGIEKLPRKENNSHVTLSRLSGCYYHQKDYSNAIYYGEECVAAAEKHLGAKHLDTAMYIYNLGMIYYKKKRWNKAKERLQQALVLISHLEPSNSHIYTIKIILEEINFYSSKSRSK